MELGLHKVWNGLKLIKQSLQLVVTHPVLLVYGICSFIISHALLMAFRASQYSIESHWQAITNNPDYYRSYEKVLLSDAFAQYDQYYAVFMMILMFIMFFFLACLAHHAMHILKSETHGITEAINGVVRRLPILSAWFIFKIIISTLFITALMPRPTTNAFFFLFSIMRALIHYITSLVMTILATEKTGLMSAIKRSYHLVVDYWMIFLGIFLIFDLLNSTNFLIVIVWVDQLAILTYTIFYYEYYVRIKAA